MSDSFTCNTYADPLILRTIFFIDDEQRYAYLTAGSLDFAVSIINLVMLVNIRALRQPPNEILIVLSSFSLLKIVLIYITIIYDEFYPINSNPSNFLSFCWGTGFIEIAARSAKTIYTLILTFIYAHKIKNPLKAWSTPTKEIHFISLFLVLLISLVCYFTGSIGMTVFGFCGFSFSLFSSYLLAVSDILYLFALMVSSWIFLKNVKSISASDMVIKQFYTYYKCFLVVIFINQLLTVVGQFFVAASCGSRDISRVFRHNKILANLANCTLSLFVLGIIFCNRQFRRLLSLRLIRGLYDRVKKWMIKQRSSPNGYQIRPSFYEQLLTTNRKTILVQLATLSKLDSGYLSNLKDKGKACFLSSVLGCLSLQNFQIRQKINSTKQFRTSAVEQDTNELFSWNFNQNYTLTLTKNIVDHYNQIFTKKIPPVIIKFTSYSPNVMYSFAEMNQQIGLWKQLAPLHNEDAIARDCDNSGGRSGQFFFFNQTKTLLLKTITCKEKNVYLERLKQFHKHFSENPQSLIVKIYSMATIVNNQSGDEVSFSLMGNIMRGINKKFIQKSYDLKGSLHSREVLKNRAKPGLGERVQQTLKDVDFNTIEGKIWLDQKEMERMKKIIEIDSRFLCKQGLIDYSLLVIKLNTELFRDHPEQIKLLKQLKHFRSSRQEGIVYIFGIIDYLQTWNLRKKGQKWYKSLFTHKNEISSQNPQFYSERFIAYTQRIFSLY